MSLSIRQNNFTIVPQNLTEAMAFADLIAKSSFCPDAMKGKSGDILVAMQMGAEVGLSPMQSLQNIAVIKGRPTLWGDAALAVVMAHPCYVSHREWMEGNLKDGTRTAYISITRKNSEQYIVSFSIDQAKAAGLWGKAGPWTQYPDRMLQMRARGFAIRDKFADALRGINIAEEVQDYKDLPKKKSNGNVIDMSPDRPQLDTQSNSMQFNAETEHDIKKDLEDIDWSNTIDDLEKAFKASYKHWVSMRHQDNVKLVIDAKDKRKAEILAEEKADTVDQETGEVNNDE